MASTLTFIPIVGLDNILVLHNNTLDNILLQRTSALYPDLPVDATGRPGRSRIGFKLLQNDGLTADDLELNLVVRCPIPIVLPEDAENFAKWSPLCRISMLASASPEAPQIASFIPAGQNNPGLAFSPQNINIAIKLSPPAAGSYFYEVLVDFLHSVAS